MNQELLERAKVNLDRSEYDEAISNLIGFLDGAPGHPEAAFMLGGAFLAKGKPGVASILTGHALRLKGTFPEAFMNIGSCFRMMLMNQQAEEFWKIALEQETIPAQRAQLLACLSTLHINEGEPQKAIDYLNRALEIIPNDKTFRYNRGLARLELEDWGGGWDDYEAGFGTQNRLSRKYGETPLWDGQENQTVIVWGEQGVGDEIMFASVLPDMIKVCKKVIFDCHPRLVETFKRSFPECEIYGTRKQQTGVSWVNDTKADAHVCVSSLAKFFRRKSEDFTGKPFLKAQHQTKPAFMRIGLAWAGGTHKTRADLRSIPLLAFEPLVRSAHSNAEFYSLQYTPNAAKEVCDFEDVTGKRIKHIPSIMNAQDYDKTVNFVAGLDLVITVCTTIHHVAGGLGIPCWTLVPSKPAWRYGLQGEKSRWYESVRLIRQIGHEPWSNVIQRVANDLAHFGQLQAAE